MMKKKVLAVTGIRSEYDILYPVLRELKGREGFELKIAVTGAHLSDWHGFTLDKIKQDGFEVAELIDYLLMTNRKTQRAKGVGLLIEGLTQTVERLKPDFLLFVGDREESIATCIVGNYMDVLVAHIGGGDPVFGNADDPVRLACSKLAHIHFATAEQYAENIRKLGEEDFRICFSGNPALNNIAETEFMTRSQISEGLGMDVEHCEYVVVLKHPLSSELEDAYTQMKITMEALKNFTEKHGMKAVGIYPNTDPGSYDIIKAINDSCDDNIKFYKTLPRELFVNLMRNARALIGNSSMGILEAPFYKLPVINVGNRQQGRLNAGNVEFVHYDRDFIGRALEKACFDDVYRAKVKDLKNPYGDGNAHKVIADFLEQINPDDRKWYIKRKLI
jgi:GDP/UDP-N,N'-diacetylbacillosamine 2-epimerase (hydrolysing)